MSRSIRALAALSVASLLAATVLVSITIAPAAAAGLVSIADVTEPEGSGGGNTLDFVVSSSVPNPTGLEIDYTTSDGSAKSAGGDYTSTTDTLLIPAPLTSGIISIPVGTDSAAEPNETFTVTISSEQVGTVIADGTATGTIQNDDGLAPSFSVADVTHDPEGNAGGTNATFTVTLSASSTLETKVDYTTSPVTATEGTDYGDATNTLTFAPTETEKTFNVSVTGDTTDEVNETFLVTLSNPDDATIGDGTATGTITDDDAPPALTIEPESVGEGNSGEVVMTFTAELSAASGKSATFDFATGAGSEDPATAGVDYESKAGTVTFAPGDTSEEVTVTVNGDTLSEADETFVLNLSNPLNLTLPDPAVVVGTIEDDETLPTISVANTSAAEGNTGTSVKDVTVTLSAPSGQTVTVDYATSEGTASEPEDYTTASGTLIFTPGQVSKTFPVTIKGDLLDEPNETIDLTLSDPSDSATIADGSGVLTISDDDATPALTIDDVSKAEGNAGTSNADFTVTLSAPSGQDVTVLVSSANESATAGADYGPISNQLVTIEAGDTTATVSVGVFGDTVDETDETATLNLSGATNATITDFMGVLTILDNDTGPALSVNDVTDFEETGGGHNVFTFTVTLGATSEQTVTVDFATANGSATAPSDFSAFSGTLTFIPGDTSETVGIFVARDSLPEPSEVFTLGLTAPTNASIADDTGVGTIDNDDGPAATLSIADDTAAESESAVFSITLSSPASQDVTFDVATSPDEATATADYDPAGASKTITAGNSSTTFSVPIVDDNIDEPAEDFNVTVSNATNVAIADGSAVGTITDNDDTPSITIADESVGEAAGPANVDLTLSNPRSVDVTVQFSTANGTAESDDYTSTSGTATFTAGSTSTSIPVTITNDTVDEPDDTVAITLDTPSNATIADGDGVLTITDNDLPPSVSIADATAVTEGDAGTTNASFTATLSAASEHTVTVTQTPTAGTANASDFTTTGGTVTFVPLDTSETVLVPVVGDTKAEINEAFTVVLSSPSQVTINDGSGAGSITDDDGGGTFTPVAPFRRLDTRDGTGTTGPGKLGPAATLVLDVTGFGGVPASGVDAVVINTTAHQPTATSFLSVTPSGGSSTSNLNFTANQTVANLVTVQVGGDGNIRVRNQAGSTHVIGDIVGWYATDDDTTPASHFVSVGPSRVLDTRNGTGRGGNTAKVGPGQTIVLDVTGVGGVPATNVAAVVVNTTATQPTAGSFLSVTPSGGASTSNLNFTTNQTIANLVTVPVGGDGNIRIRNQSGSTHVIGDVVGWYTTPGTLAASVFEPVTPARILDTRNGTGRGGNTAKVGAGQTIVVDVTGVGGVPATGVASVVANTTVTQPTATGFLSVTPNGGSSTSSLNFTANRTVPNLVIVGVGSGGNIRIYNSAGTSHILADVVGWFTAAAT